MYEHVSCMHIHVHVCAMYRTLYLHVQCSVLYTVITGIKLNPACSSQTESVLPSKIWVIQSPTTNLAKANNNNACN